MNTLPLRACIAALFTVVTLCAMLVGERAAWAQPVSDSLDILLENAKVVDVKAGRVLAGQDILIQDGRLVAVQPADPDARPPARHIVDAAGRFLIPGLWDMHVHALSSEAQIANAFALFLAHGVTGIRDVGSFLPPDTLFRIADEVESGERLGPHVIPAGAVLDGPPGAWPGMRLAATSAEARAEAQGHTLTRMLRDAGVPMLASTDAGWINPYIFYGASLHDELERLVAAGLTPAEALQAATLVPARFLGLEAEMGTVEAGRRADLVLLDGNPLEAVANLRRIHAVVVHGRVLDRDALDRLLADAAASPAQ